MASATDPRWRWHQSSSRSAAISSATTFSMASLSPWLVGAVPRPPRLDEHAFGVDGDAVLIGQITRGERLDAVDAGGRRFGVQLAQPGGPHVAKADRSGQPRINAVAGGLAQQVIENQGGDSAVHVPGRSLAGGAEMKIAPAF